SLAAHTPDELRRDSVHPCAQSLRPEFQKLLVISRTATTLTSRCRRSVRQRSESSPTDQSFSSIPCRLRNTQSPIQECLRSTRFLQNGQHFLTGPQCAQPAKARCFPSGWWEIEREEKSERESRKERTRDRARLAFWSGFFLR